MQATKTVKKYETYKDSGIEWIGEIPQDWKVLPHKYILSKVKNICEKYAGEDIISLTMKGVIKRDLDNPMGKMPLTFDGYQRIEAGNLLLCLFDIDVTPRCVGLIKDNGLTSPAYSQFEFLGLDCPQYYTYLLTMIDDDKCFLHLAKNLRSSLTEDNFGAILTIQPTVKEQQVIADYLDKKWGDIDRVVEAEKSVIEKLKEYKQSIITEAVTKGLDKSVPLKDSGIEWIGKIPQHWKVIKLKYLSTSIGDGIHSTPNYDDSGDIYFVNGNNIGQDNLIFKEDTKKINLAEFENYNKPNLSENTIFITLNGATYGKTSFYNGEIVLLGKSAGYVTLNKEQNKKYIRYYLQSNVAKFIMDLSLSGTTIANLSLATLNDFTVTYPSLIVQQQIAEYLDKKCSEIDKAIADKEQLIKKFTEYKKSLIYECVTGKRKVVV